MTSKQNLLTDLVDEPLRRNTGTSRRSARIEPVSLSGEDKSRVSDALPLLSSVSHASTATDNRSARQHRDRKRRRQSAADPNNEQTSAQFSREARLHKPSPSGSRQHISRHIRLAASAMPHNRQHHWSHDHDLQLSSTAPVGHDIVADQTYQSKQIKAKQSQAEERASKAQRHLESSVRAEPSADVKCKPQFVEPAVPTKRTRFSSPSRNRAVSKRVQQSAILSADPCTGSTSEMVIERRVLAGTSVRLPGRVNTCRRQSVSYFW